MSNDIDKLFRAVKSGDERTAAALGDKMKDGLSDEKRQMLERALQDGDYLKSLLSSDKAKRIIESLNRKEGG